MVFLLISISLILIGFYTFLRINLRPNGLFMPDAYILGICIYTIGALNITYFDNIGLGKDVVLMSLITLSSATLGCIGFILLFGSFYKNISLDYRFYDLRYGQKEKFVVIFGLITCSIVCFIFMYTISQNEVISAFLSFASNSENSNLLEARKAITSGSEGYFAPGFVKQFRDNLFPIFLICLMLMNVDNHKESKYRFLFYFFLIIAVISMLMSGIRSVLVIMFLTLFFARSFIIKTTKVKGQKNNVLSLVFILILFYGMLTIFLGRVSEDDSFFISLLGIVPNLFERVFVAAPEANILTYNFWGSIGPTNGQSWIEELSSILPVEREYGLSNQLHALTGGSDQGNSPLGMPADIWFAWGWIGNLIIPIFYSLALGIFDIFLMSKRSIVLVSIKIFMMVSLLKIYSPFGFILYGGAASVILLVAILIIKSQGKYHLGIYKK